MHMETLILKTGPASASLLWVNLASKGPSIVSDQKPSSTREAIHNGTAGCPMTATRRYTLAELLDQCDAQAPIPQGIKDWEAAPSAGREVL